MSSEFYIRFKAMSWIVVAIAWTILVAWVIEYLITPYDRIYKGDIPGYSFPVDLPIEDWGDKRLIRSPGEDDLSLADRLNRIVKSAYYHCNPDDAARPLDRFISKILPKSIMQDGFLGPRNMRCGFCHQSAYILSRALEANGVRSYTLGLNGHVVSLVKLNGGEYIYDPDFGVGHIDYKNYRYDDIKSIYAKNGRWTKALEPVYATREDDFPYSPMFRLWLKERVQALTTFFVELGLLLLLVLSILYSAVLLFSSSRLIFLKKINEGL